MVFYHGQRGDLEYHRLEEIGRSDSYVLKSSRSNSRFFGLAAQLWRLYMPSIQSGMTFAMLERLMSQRPDVQESAEEVWNDLFEHGNLVEV